MTSKETAVRTAAQTLHDAIMAAREAGLVVHWPHRPEDLPAIAISETGKATVTATVAAVPGTDPAVVEKAGVAAQKAADRVTEGAATKKVR